MLHEFMLKMTKFSKQKRQFHNLTLQMKAILYI
jgi:hypothetical protein